MTAMPEFDEMLSAYLDGELSPAEAARVEARLARSPELRAVVSDYKSLGGEVRAVAVPPLGLDFSGRVMAGIATKPMSRDAGAWWTGRRARAALIAVAGAGLAAMVMVALRGPAVEPGAPTIAANEPKSSEPREAVPEVAQPVETPTVAASAVPSVATGELKVASTDPRELVGRIVEAWDPKGVAVVRVYVVDYDATWERLQVVLEDRAFATTTETPETKAGDLVAVLAEGTPDRIGEALAALASDQGVVSLDVADKPLLVAALDERVKAGFAPLALANRPGFKLPGEVAGDTDAVRTRSAGGAGSLPAPRVGTAPAGVVLDTPVAWARPVAVPEGLLPAGHPLASKNGPAATVDAKQAASPVQVLFVLEQRK